MMEFLRNFYLIQTLISRHFTIVSDNNGDLIPKWGFTIFKYFLIKFVIFTLYSIMWVLPIVDLTGTSRNNRTRKRGLERNWMILIMVLFSQLMPRSPAIWQQTRKIWRSKLFCKIYGSDWNGRVLEPSWNYCHHSELFKVRVHKTDCCSDFTKHLLFSIKCEFPGNNNQIKVEV